MSASVIKADYEQLQQIATQFENEAEQIRQQTAAIKTQVETLRTGDWEGTGANLFYDEMDDSVLPSLTRLSQAMSAANRSTLQILGQMQQAEDESAQLLLMRGGSGQARGGLGQPGAGGGGSPNNGNSRLHNIEVLPMPASGNTDNPSTSSSNGPTGIPYLDAIIKNLKLDYELKMGGGDEGPQYGIEIAKSMIWGKKFWGEYGEIQIGGVSGGIGLMKQDGKWILGPSGEFSGGSLKLEGTVLGDKEFGKTQGIEIKVLKLEGLLGYKDGSLGRNLEGNLASIKAMGGYNIAGKNVGMYFEYGLKLGEGVKVGKENVLKFGPFSLGFTISDAKN